MAGDEIPLEEFDRLHRHEERNGSAGRGHRPRQHSPIMKNGRPLDLQPLHTIDIGRWHGAEVPERRWIVPNMIPEGTVTMLGGDGGVGKSQLALQLLVACAIGKPWLGMPTRRCKAVAVFCEDDEDELNRRLADVLRHYGAAFADLEDLTLLSRVGEDNLLVAFTDQWQPGEPTALYTQLESLARDEGAELLVLDSLHDFFGGNENSRPHARQFVNELRTIALEMAGGVVLTAHPSLSGRNSGTGEAGSTGWNNTVRSRLYFTAPRHDDGEAPDRDYRELLTKKANYAAAGGVVKLRWIDGVFVRDDEPTGMLGTIKRRSVEEAFLECLDAATSQGRYVSDASNSPRYAPKMFSGMTQASGNRAPELKTAMLALFDRGEIIVGSILGADRHPVKAIIRTDKALYRTSAGSAGSPPVSD